MRTPDPRVAEWLRAHRIKTISALARSYGLSYCLVRQRILRGCTLAEVVSQARPNAGRAAEILGVSQQTARELCTAAGIDWRRATDEELEALARSRVTRTAKQLAALTGYAAPWSAEVLRRAGLDWRRATDEAIRAAIRAHMSMVEGQRVELMRRAATCRSGRAGGRRARRIDVGGESLSLREVAARAGIAYSTLWQRADRTGRTVDEEARAALEAPGPRLTRALRPHKPAPAPARLSRRGARYEACGESLTVPGWAARLGVCTQTVRAWLRRGELAALVADCAAGLRWQGSGCGRVAHLVEIDGERLTVPAWAKRVGLTRFGLYKAAKRNNRSVRDEIASRLGARSQEVAA